MWLSVSVWCTFLFSCTQTWRKTRGGIHFSKWKFHFPCFSSLSQQLGSVGVQRVFSELCPVPWQFTTCIFLTCFLANIRSSSVRLNHVSFFWLPHRPLYRGIWKLSHAFGRGRNIVLGFFFKKRPPMQHKSSPPWLCKKVSGFAV